MTKLLLLIGGLSSIILLGSASPKTETVQTTPVNETVNLEEDARKADLLVLKDEVTNKIKKLEHLI